MDNSPTTPFTSYEHAFSEIATAVKSQLEAERKGERGEQRKATLRNVQMELEEADETVSQMEIELQAIPQSIKGQYETRLKTAKTELTRLKKLFRDSQFSRDELFSEGRFGTPSSDEPYGPTSDRTRLLAGTASLEDGTRRLQESHRIALETEDQGAEILLSLRVQREQIENARDTLQTADSAIDRASGTLKKMIRRMYRQRVVVAGIIILSVLLIAFILYSKLFA